MIISGFFNLIRTRMQRYLQILEEVLRDSRQTERQTDRLTDRRHNNRQRNRNDRHTNKRRPTRSFKVRATVKHREAIMAFHRVQKKSRLHGCEPEEDFAFYVTFEEGFVIFINNPVSAKFSVNVTSTVTGRALPQHNF